MTNWHLSDSHGMCIVDDDTGKLILDYSDIMQALWDDRNSNAEYRYIAGKIHDMLEATVKLHNEDTELHTEQCSDAISQRNHSQGFYQNGIYTA